MQFSLGGGQGIYNPPYTAQDLAVLPGQPNSVAVYSNNGIVTIYDSGVARAKTSSGLSIYFNQNYGSLSFGSSASTLYLNSQSVGATVYALTIDATGVTSAKSLGAGSGNSVYYGNSLQYDIVTWWSRAVNFISLCSLAAFRTPASPCDTRAPLCVGRVLD